MPISINESNLKQGVLGLVMALVEIIRDVLRTQALTRLEDGSLDEEEEERLGDALWELDKAIEEIKCEHGIDEAVRAVRDGLDEIVDSVVERILNPEKWSSARGEL